MNPDAYITRAQAAMVTGVTADAIGKWHARGWTGADGTHRRLATKPGRGKHLRYRLGDILDAERDTRTNPNSRRGTSLLAAA